MIGRRRARGGVVDWELTPRRVSFLNIILQHFQQFLKKGKSKI
jgi:hypothetical protein